MQASAEDCSMPGTVLRPGENKTQTLPHRGTQQGPRGGRGCPSQQIPPVPLSKGTEYCFHMSLLF